MTARDSPVHDSASQPQPSSAPYRRRALSTASARSPLSASKRSPSPRVTFTAGPLSPDAKGVQNITRKVIRTLEVLGHLDSTSMHEQDSESDERLEQQEVAVTLNGFSSQDDSRLHIQDPSHSININGLSSPPVKAPSRTKPPALKIDWEIPRKVLHSSIGFFTIYLYISETDVKTVVIVLWTALAFIIPADILRLRSPRFERMYEHLLGFLMRESEKKTTNGVIWYILGVNFALSFYPQDVATIAILILSWADTAASTFGRLLGTYTPPLPSHLPFLRLPLAPRKSLAGFLAATITGALIAVGFWVWIAPLRYDGSNVSWRWDGGVCPSSTLGWSRGLVGAGGWSDIGTIGLVAGLVSGIAEALDIGSLDDNLTLPIISGGCIWGYLKLLRLFSTF